MSLRVPDVSADSVLSVRDHLSGTLASVDEIQRRHPEYLIVS